jgi:hypothetical protein
MRAQRTAVVVERPLDASKPNSIFSQTSVEAHGIRIVAFTVPCRMLLQSP